MVEPFSNPTCNAMKRMQSSAFVTMPVTFYTLGYTYFLNYLH